MNLENHVVSLELAKKLKELGVKQESLFEWSTTQNGQNISLHETLLPSHRNFNSPYYKSYSAFTASELGELLPVSISSEDSEYGFVLTINKSDERDYFSVSYENYDFDYGETSYEKNLSNSLAKMLIYLLKNDLLKLK